MHARVQQQRRFIGRKESVYMSNEFISHRIGLALQHGGRFIVLELQYGCNDDVMCIRSIALERKQNDTVKFKAVLTNVNCQLVLDL